MGDWLNTFVQVLVRSGVSINFAAKYLPGGKYHRDALQHFNKGLSPEEAATAELMPGAM